MAEVQQIPFKFKPRFYQLPLFRALDNGILRAIIFWHRRSGKDKACFNYMIKRACKRVGTYFYFLPEYSQAKKVIWENIDIEGFKMLDHIPQKLIKRINNTDLLIELVNGSVIQLMGADTFDSSGVGTNPVGVVFSEFPIQKPHIWNFLRPILKVNGGWAIFNGTPRGQNHAFNLFELAKTLDSWFTQILTVEDTGVLSLQDIEEERAEGMTQAMIDQEYYCKFIENATNFFRNINQVCTEIAEEPIDTHFYKMGVDLAKYVDMTSISVIDLNTFKQVYKESFNGLDWNLQKARIAAIYFKYGQPEGHIDATGVGDPIVEDLANMGVNLTPVKFNENNRKDILTNLAIKMEQLIIKLLNDEQLKKQLSYFQYVLGHSGKLKIEVPDGLHDDDVFSIALAVWEMPSEPVRTFKQYYTSQNQTAGGVQPFYSDLGI